MAAASTKISFTFIKILTGSDLSRRRLPMMAAVSANPGPVVWLTGCGHGDEVGGMVVIQEIFKIVRKSGLSRGALYAFPLMNPIGFETASRNITMSKEDLNRSFPGNSSGSLAERIAHKIFTTIQDTNPDLVLDLHNDWMKSVPYTLLDPTPVGKEAEVYDKERLFAGKSGFLMVLDTDDIHRTLSSSLLRQNIPALSLELGESFVVNERNVEFGVKSILNILSYLEMITPTEEYFEHPMVAMHRGEVLRFSDKPVSSTSGVIRFLRKPGDSVMRGKPVARIYNPFGKLQQTVVAQDDGIVLGHSDSSVAFPGAPVMAFGIGKVETWEDKRNWFRPKVQGHFSKLST
jgi:predicted deacylase